MIVSRAYGGLKGLAAARRLVAPAINNSIVRHGHYFSYRSRPEASKKMYLYAEIFGSIFWGWVFYHVINDYERLTGEFYEPDPSLWTDEELGIPPDDYVADDGGD